MNTRKEQGTNYFKLIATNIARSYLSSSATTITPYHLCCVDCLVLNSGFEQKIKIKLKYFTVVGRSRREINFWLQQQESNTAWSSVLFK